MEYLIQLLKNSPLLSLALIAASLFFGLILIPFGIGIVFRAKRYLTIAIFLLFTFFPLVISFASIGARWMDDHWHYKMNESQPGDPIFEKIKSENQTDYITSGVIGLVSSGVPFLIGLSGFVVKRRQ